MATYWENSCSFGLRYVSWYKYLIVSLVFSHLGFWSGNLFLIAPFPDLCLLVPFYNYAWVNFLIVLVLLLLLLLLLLILLLYFLFLHLAQFDYSPFPQFPSFVLQSQIRQHDAYIHFFLTPKIIFNNNLWWFFLFYVLVFKIFLCCWRLMYVFIFLVKLR